MSRALAKRHLCVAAVDDGPFSRDQRTAPLAVVVVTSPQDLDDVQLGRVAVDGSDATDVIARLVRSSRPFAGVRAVLLDGIAFGGFNVVDLDELALRLRRPVVAVTRRPPDFPAIRAALATYFPADAPKRWRSLTARPLFEVRTGALPILAACAGCTRAEARALVHRTTVRGVWPEPLRWAALVARAGRRRFAAER